jgi:hypothetical protein
MTFNIGSQSGGVVNNVAGNQYVAGGQQGRLVTREAAERALLDVRDALRAMPLDRGTADQARDELHELDRAVQGAEPDRPRAARSLERLTRLLLAAGSLASAGGTVVTSLQTLAGWLGSVADPVLRLLAG